MRASTVAEPDESPRLAGVPSIIGFAVVLVSLLGLVFPTGREYAETTLETKPDAYSLAYLDVLTRANPKELDLRLVYARHLGALGRWEEALRVLEPATKDKRLGVEAKNLDLDLRVAEARSLPEGSESRAQAFAKVKTQLGDLARVKQTPARLRELAELALSLNDPALAAEVYATLAERLPEQRGAMLALSARWLRASGAGAKASQRYQEAMEAEPDVTKQAEYARLAVVCMEADDKVRQASDLATQYALRFPKSAEMLGEATRLATACSHMKLARDLGRRWLALVPGDDAIMRAQVTRELAMADPRAALALLKKLVARHPKDVDLRYQEANVAEWAGDLDTVKRDLIWLLNQPTPKK